MKIIFTFIVFLSLQVSLLGQNFCNVETIYGHNFDVVVMRSQVSKDIAITNNGNEKVSLNSVIINSHYEDYISFPDFQSPVEIYPSESYTLKVILKAKQNIDFRGIIFLNVTCSNFQYSIPVEIKATITTGGDARITDNLHGPELIDAISGYLQNHNSFSYRDARKLFWGSFDKKDGLVECVYTGKTIDPGIDPDFAVLDGLGFNTEHTWPRSLGASNEPAESDINHLFVTDKTANDKRANYPFGFVESDITYENGGSKLGKNSDGETVFEVRDKYKGNIARAIFYFAIRYNNPTNFLNRQERDLRAWMQIDPVDASEYSRNDSVIKYQKRSNLFIQYPELLDRMPSISMRAYPEYVPNYFLSDTGIVFDLSKFDASAKIRIWITNFSNKSGNDAIPFVIHGIETSVTEDIFDLEFESQNLFIPVDSIGYIDIKCKNLNINASGRIKINYDNSHSEIVNVYAVNASVSVKDFNEMHYSVKNYPNPASESTNIELSGIYSSQSLRSVKVYDMLQGEVADITSNVRFSDSKASVDLSPSSIVKSGQVYFVRFEMTSGFSIIHPIIFLN
jgi:hypothetical protein